MNRKQPKIVVIGAGFGGVALCKALKNKPFDVLLIDKHNYHTFQPLLYQVATGGLEAGSVAYPVRRIFRRAGNIRFQMAEVQNIDVDQRKVHTDLGTTNYDFLVLATGSTTNLFGMQKRAEKLLTLKSVPDALDLRSFLMQNFEQAIAADNEEQRKILMNVAIIGGGPTGLELAGAIAEMRTHVLPKDFPQIDFDQMEITLFEASSKLLGHMSPSSSKHSRLYLEKLGVVVRLDAKVTDYYDRKVYLDDGTHYPTETVIWTAGVKANVPAGIPRKALASNGQVKADIYSRVLNLEDVFAIGDVALVFDGEKAFDLPMVAPVAIQQAKLLATNMVRILEEEELKPFKYNDQGMMATIGRNKAVVDLKHFKFRGFFAWLVWMGVHLISLVGFRNKLITLIDWTRNYFSYDRPLGLIIRKEVLSLKRSENKTGEKRNIGGSIPASKVST